MTKSANYTETLRKLVDLAPSGFAIALNIEYTSPALMFESYSENWLKHYSENGMLMKDPTVLWAFENQGWIDWRNLREVDKSEILNAAAEFGLTHGMSTASLFEDKRCMGGFSRSDRPFNVEEAEQINQLFLEICSFGANIKDIEKADRDAIQSFGVAIRHS